MGSCVAIMKVIAIVLALATLAFGERFTGEIDWSKVRPVEDLANLRQIRTPKVENRIVNGFFAEPHQFPYQVACLIDFPAGTALCGGSVLSPNFILTAAHCVHDSLNKGAVLLGAHNITDKTEDNTKIVFNEVIEHENYSPAEIKNDIALIRLSEPVEFSDFIKTSRLPTRSEAERDFADEISLISGWGRFQDSIRESSDVLRFVENPVLTNKVCSRFYFGLVGDNQICMSGKEGRGSCQGDSGGPLVVNIDGKISQVGVVSFGIALGCEKGFPTVFTRVTSFLDWIETNSDLKIPL